MKTRIQSIHFDADSKLLEYIETKLAKLPHYFSDITSASVYLKLDKASDHENKVVEIRLEVPGYHDLFVSSRNKSFEHAFDKSLDVLKNRVVKVKEKIRGN